VIVATPLGMMAVVRCGYAEYPGAVTKTERVAKHDSNKAAKHVAHVRRHSECFRKWLKGFDCPHEASSYLASCNGDAQRRFLYPQDRPRLSSAWQPCGIN